MFHWCHAKRSEVGTCIPQGGVCAQDGEDEILGDICEPWSRRREKQAHIFRWRV